MLAESKKEWFIKIWRVGGPQLKVANSRLRGEGVEPPQQQHRSRSRDSLNGQSTAHSHLRSRDPP